MAQATDPKVKEAILKEIADGKSVTQAAKDHGVKEPTIYYWKKKKKKRAGKRKAKAAPNGAPKKAGKRRRMKKAPSTFRLADHLAADTPPEVVASLEKALSEIEQAGKTLRAIQKAARQVFGV